jgi:hypothetical protein
MSATTWFFLGMLTGWLPAFVVVVILLARAMEARE